jgi:hypothetical protein
MNAQCPRQALSDVPIVMTSRQKWTCATSCSLGPALASSQRLRFSGPGGPCISLEMRLRLLANQIIKKGVFTAEERCDQKPLYLLLFSSCNM